jgi:hypothetical protein
MPQVGSYLVVAPLSTLNNWTAEFKRFTPDIPVLLYHGTAQVRQAYGRYGCSTPATQAPPYQPPHWPPLPLTAPQEREALRKEHFAPPKGSGAGEEHCYRAAAVCRHAGVLLPDLSVGAGAYGGHMGLPMRSP